LVLAAPVGVPCLVAGKVAGVGPLAPVVLQDPDVIKVYMLRPRILG
jgi:hypothetical protein